MEQIVLANGSVIEYDVKNGRVVGDWPMKKSKKTKSIKSGEISGKYSVSGASWFENSYTYKKDAVQYQGHTHYIAEKDKEHLGPGVEVLKLEFDCGRELNLNPDRYRQFFSEESVSRDDEPEINICPGCSKSMDGICRL